MTVENLSEYLASGRRSELWASEIQTEQQPFTYDVCVSFRKNLKIDKLYSGFLCLH